MIPKVNQAERLRAEREQLMGKPQHASRIAWIDRELAKLAKRREAGKARRELLYDLNGHHGRA